MRPNSQPLLLIHPMIKSITDFKKPLSNQVINFKQQLQNILANIIIPPQTKFGRYIGITLSVRPCNCIWSISFIWKNIGSSYLTKIVYDLKMCHDFDQMSFEQVQGQSPEEKVQN